MSNFTNEAQAFQVKSSVGATDWLVDVSSSSVKLTTLKVVASAGASITPVLEVTNAGNLKLAVGAGKILVSAVSATTASAVPAGIYVKLSSTLGPVYVAAKNVAW